MAIVENRSTEIGDVMRIESDVPVVGIVTLNNYVDDIEGEQIIDGVSVAINNILLSNSLTGRANFNAGLVDFTVDYVGSDVGILEIEKNALNVGKTYKLEFKVTQNVSDFQKLNLYHSSASAIIQYSSVSVGSEVNVLCLITPNNKRFRHQ